MPQIEPRSSQINIRIRASQRNLIDRAAAAANKNRSDFMLEAACKEAENVLLDKRLFFIDDLQFDEFKAAIKRPVDDNLGILKLLASKSPWEK